MSFRQGLTRDSDGGGLAAVALAGAVVLPIVMLFIYVATGLRFPLLMLAAVVGAMALVAIGVRGSAGGDT